MTSMASESVATILCTSRQTRFAIETPNYRELDIGGLNITVTSGEQSAGKGKSKAKAEGLEILSGAQLRLKAGQRYALIGRNGTGKSTLLKAIAEKLIPGIPEETRIALLQQSRLSENDNAGFSSGKLSSEANVLEEVVDKATARNAVEQEIAVLSDSTNAADPYASLRALRSLKHERIQKRLFLLDKDARLRSGTRGIQARKALVEYEKVVAESNSMLEQPVDEITSEALQAETQEAADMLAELQIQVEPNRLANIETKAKNILTGLGFSETQWSKSLRTLSGGWHMRAALAATLLQDSTDILILDEPTNYLDMLGIIWLQRYLQALEDSDRPPTLILVSHDRDFVGLCTDLMILKDKTITYFHGDLPTYESSQAERKLYLKTMKEAKDKQKAHIEKSIAANIKAGKASNDQNKLRQAKSRQKKLDDRWGMEVGANGGRFKLNRDNVGFSLTKRVAIEVPPDEKAVFISLPEPAELRFPGSLMSLEKVSYRYSSKSPVVVKDVNLSIGMGDRIGILGLNGAGKSTLIKLLVGDTRPTTGTATTHARLKLAWYDQFATENLQALGRSEPGLTPLSLLTREVDGALHEGEIRALLGELGLPGRVASDTPLTKLSGGQLVRCELARLFWKRPHCFVLDEVTTHLDYETVGALRDALCYWEGAVVLVTHDRWFMRGAVEGQIDEDEDDEVDSEVEEQESLRKRIVYRLKGGTLNVLESGVDGFERLMEKRAEKLLNQ